VGKGGLEGGVLGGGQYDGKKFHPKKSNGKLVICRILRVGPENSEGFEAGILGAVCLVRFGSGEADICSRRLRRLRVLWN